MKVSRLILGCVALCIALAAGNALAASIASDDAEAYTGGNYTDENQGTGFSGSFAFKPFGASDQGGEFIDNGSRRISGSQSFGLFANEFGTGSAVSRDFSTPASKNANYVLTFRVRLDLDTNAGNTAGFIISSGTTASKANWSDDQRLFIGISGDGTWKYDDGTLNTVTTGSGASNFTASGGDIYLVTLTFNPVSNAYSLLIANESNPATSDTMSGSLGGTPASAVRSLAVGNGVIGGFQTVIFDDIDLDDTTPVELSDFSASVQPNGSVAVEWSTASEIDHAGFNVFRSAMDVFDATRSLQVNAALIAAQGSLGQGASYALTDDAIPAGVWYYFLEDVDTSGVRTLHGPVQVDLSAPTSADITALTGGGSGPLILLLALAAAVALGGVALFLRNRPKRSS